MSVQLLTAAFPASGLIQLQPAKYFFCLAAPLGGYAFQIWGPGGAEAFGQPASLVAPVGLKIGRIKGWASCNLSGVAGQSITYMYGDETVAPQDITDVSLQIATITGSVTIAGTTNSVPESTANQVTDHADVAVGAGATDASIGVNAARRWVTIGSLAANAPATTNLRVRGHGDVVGGIELQPGMNFTFQVQAAFDVFNGDANAQTYWWQEAT